MKSLLDVIDIEVMFFSFVIAILLMIILGLFSAIYVNRQPVNVTEVSPNCFIIEQGGFKTFKCANVINVEKDK
jgi:hypothetical protein